jgi:uncharacterized protein (DUF2126 family)
MHFGQGKWYPGEQLPRWSLNCFWRKDGEPIWHSPALYADERSHTARMPTGRRFLQAGRRAPGPGRPSMCFRPSRTSTTTCGASVACRAMSIPSIRASSDPLERGRLMKVFSQGLTQTVGHVLPMACSARADAGRPGRGSCARSAAT